MTRLHRSFAPWHPAAAYALGCSLLIGLLAGISHGASSGVHGGLAVFLGWATVRELAPSRLVPGLLAPWTTLVFAIPAEADLRACLVVMLAARIAAGTTGGAPRLLDCAVLVALAAWSAVHPAGFPVALVLAAVLFVEGGRIRHRVAGALALGGAMLVGSLEGTATVRATAGSPNTAELVLDGLVLVAALVAIARRPPTRLRERPDRGTAGLVGRRVRSARIVMLFTLAAATVWTGLLAPFTLAAGSGALIAVALSGAGYRAASGTDPAAGDP